MAKDIGKAIREIEEEIERYSAINGIGFSRWRFGYIDGLTAALKILKEDNDETGI